MLKLLKVQKSLYLVATLFGGIMNMSNSSANPVLAFDIETSGPKIGKNALLSIGATLMDPETKEEITSFQCNISMPEGLTFDPDTKTNFWDNNPGALAFVSASAKDPKTAMAELSAFLDKVEENHGSVKIVSDNPSFDIAWLDHYLSTYADRRPLRYSKAGIYRMVWDSASIQKIWLCHSERVPDMAPPKGHRKRLRLDPPYPRDHNPLNDARSIAWNYITVMEQQSAHIAALPPKPVARTIILQEYTSQWEAWYNTQKRLLENQLGDLDYKVHHVGSTSIPGLVAKPIVDMILVVPQGHDADKALQAAGFKYKGEYNLPLRRLYGKKPKADGEYEVYLHVHEEGSPEIELNLMFIAHLKRNASLREEYANLKRAIVAKDSTTTKTADTGITLYNLKKNDLIERILTEAGFDGLCPRLCTQESEWKKYKELEGSNSVPHGEHYKHLVLYKGVEVVAASRLSLTGSATEIEFLKGDKEEYSKELLQFVEKWTRRMGKSILICKAPSGDAPLFYNSGFSLANDNSQTPVMTKAIV